VEHAQQFVDRETASSVATGCRAALARHGVLGSGAAHGAGRRQVAVARHEQATVLDRQGEDLRS
jgi:hypothetical protein